MKLTMEMLERYDAPLDWFEFLNTNYPSGAEIYEVIQNPEITTEMLHFAARYFPLTEEEFEFYKKACNIKESKHFVSSEDLFDCIAIGNSKHVSNSEYVRNSENVSRSKNVYGSREVKNSKEVWNCTNITSTQRVIESTYVNRCANIRNSNDVADSQNILESTAIYDSSYIYRGVNLSGCHFGGFLKGCTNCLFCSGLENKKYYVFNKEVAPDVFDSIKADLEFHLFNEGSDFIRIDNARHDPKYRFLSSLRFDAVFEGLSPEFYGWVGTLQNYDEDIFFQVFFNDADTLKTKN